jgi:hypothetical protein
MSVVNVMVLEQHIIVIIGHIIIMYVMQRTAMVVAQEIQAVVLLVDGMEKLIMNQKFNLSLKQIAQNVIQVVVDILGG